MSNIETKIKLEKATRIAEMLKKILVRINEVLRVQTINFRVVRSSPDPSSLK